MKCKGGQRQGKKFLSESEFLENNLVGERECRAHERLNPQNLNKIMPFNDKLVFCQN